MIVLFYVMMASTFTLAKTAMLYLPPLFFIGIRMIVAGALLLGYRAIFKPGAMKIARADWFLVAQIILFHIYGAYVFEFWGIQYTTSSKACLLYNLAPFITAIISYFLFKERLTGLQIIALIIGFCGALPILITSNCVQELFCLAGFISLPELSLLLSVACTAYGWIVMKQLVDQRQYSPFLINGIGMFIGGIASLASSYIFEPWGSLLRTEEFPDLIGQILETMYGPYTAAILMAILCLACLIILSNFIGYNWYGYLLRMYSPTYLSLIGLSTPLFAALYGWLFLGEVVGISFIISAMITGFAVYLFNKKRISPAL